MSSTNIDKRDSAALNIFYGNRSVLASMRGKWVTYDVVAAYLYGGTLDILLSALGYLSICQDPRMGPLPYSVEVALEGVTQPSLRQHTLGGVLSEWANIQPFTTHYSFSAHDVLIAVDPTSSATLETIKRAQAANTYTIIIVEPETPIPPALQKMNYCGAEAAVWMPFMLSEVDAALAHRLPQRIAVCGDSLRVFSTALGALDHLCRHQGGKALWQSHAQRVIVDARASALNEVVHNFGQVLQVLGIPTCQQLPQGVQLGHHRDAAYIQPVR